MKTTLVTLALIAATGVSSAVYAQTTTQPGTPSAPTGTTTMPRTESPTVKPIASEAAAKAALEAKGYSGVKQLKRDNAGNWSGKAMKNNAEIAVMLDTTGRIREQ
ncbi:hypothetical protein [Reyranella sp.]|uniref:hypothetical protein n=1 Tax=Reyranella sp. TaxID=1929291 RepID=UPI0012206561|nr:hypothetical protein [Reyranella sp.]TAJ90030.1 MAG: hypothetical protein EPO50_06705 [Reyranella sp.]